MSEQNRIIRLEKDKEIFKRSQQVNQLGIILKGSVIAEQNQVSFLLQENDVIGLIDSMGESYSFTYKAQEDTQICLISFEGVKRLEKLLEEDKEFQKTAAFSIMNQLHNLGGLYDTLDNNIQRVYDFVKEGYQNYLAICKEWGIEPSKSDQIDYFQRFEWELGNTVEIKQYFSSLDQVAPEVLDSYFSADNYIIYYHISIACQAVKQLSRACAMLIDSLKESLNLMCSVESGNLFYLHMELLKVKTIPENGLPNLLRSMKDNITTIMEINRHMQEEFHVKLQEDSVKFKNLYKRISVMYQQSLGKVSREESVNDILSKVLEYSEIDSDTAEKFRGYMEKYREMPDKYSTEDSDRRLRMKITDIFYQLYELVFFKSEKNPDVPVFVDLFLDYGLLDEQLVEQETIDKLLVYTKEQKDNGIVCVYTMREWLREIYNGRKEPSKNEFNIDYIQQLREIKRTKEFTREQEREYLQNVEQKVRYEIENMFKINNRLTYGQITTFCPVLKEEDITRNIDVMHITSKKINEVIKSILAIDFSVFHRDNMYDNREIGIHNLIIQKQVFPDVILMPNAGCNGSMWQEITGKKRDTPGRFLLSKLTKEDVYAILLRLCGVFRWEMCKTMQGNHWNDIREKSLTSEYFDYVQFYRRNKDLTEMMRSKMALQLQKCRNSYREMFVTDYMVWIKNESEGSIRLNKVARAIFATYCPFTKELREKLGKQPLYLEAATKFERKRLRKIKELTMKRTAVRNNYAKEPKELTDELYFYEEL